METIPGSGNWKLTIRREAAGITILRAATCDARARLPETLYGLPVTALGDHALSPTAASAEGEDLLVTCGTGTDPGTWSNRDLEDLTLPRSRGVSQAWHYKEDFTGADIQQMMMIEHRNLGRLSMGANFGTGPNYIGQHIHNELEQWYIMLPGASFTYTAEDEKIHVEGGDITFTPHGSHHGSECAEGERFAYVWFELCENGYPGEIK